jgi:predicted RNA-binding protein with PIN domain
VEVVPVLIDGHNLIGRMSTLSLQDPDDEEKLVRMLKSYRARSGKSITVVFDPGAAFSLSGSRREGGVEIVFAARRSSADAVIARRIETSRNPRGWLVVTSDSELADRVARRGARLQSSEDFASELAGLGQAKPAQDDVHLSPEEIEAWLSFFGEQDGGDVLDRTD